MKALVACDRQAFYASEIDARERAGYPPFGRLAALIISAGDRPERRELCPQACGHRAHSTPRVQVLGPAEAPLAVIKGRYRFPPAVKSLRSVDLSGYLREWLAAAPKTKGNLQACGGCRSAELLVGLVSQEILGGASKKPALMARAGFLVVQQLSKVVSAGQRLLVSRPANADASNHLGRDAPDARAGQADRPRRAGR